MMDRPTGILAVGVGGQGIILATEILSELALSAGFDVKKSEVHGMSQRGGAVLAAVRFGEKVYSPLITEGEADYLLAFEKLEALRNINYLTPDGVLIANNREIYPAPVAAGLMDYPSDIEERLRKCAKNLVLLDAMELAFKAGHPRTLNVVLLGVLSTFLKIPVELWEKTIRRRVPGKAIDANMRAFHLGREQRREE
ncbi:MAG: indolepyruvate oxidoreductase subunit beta [candidate division Zixibacteria bacterium 4484_93]|nr:MAG: indolepyruvate oxidoreductase subunit beta [candidate division Zixibacteria bacterium 4484_93]